MLMHIITLLQLASRAQTQSATQRPALLPFRPKAVTATTVPTQRKCTISLAPSPPGLAWVGSAVHVLPYLALRPPARGRPASRRLLAWCCPSFGFHDRRNKHVAVSLSAAPVAHGPDAWRTQLYQRAGPVTLITRQAWR